MVQRYLALDLGASSGRGIVGAWDGERITLGEVSRFDNPSAVMRDHLYWDTPAQWRGVLDALTAAGSGLASVGIDTWGVDFGLIGSDGALLSNGVHYRDAVPPDVRSAVDERLGRETLYGVTGIAPMPFNTLYRLAALKHARASSLAAARHLLLTADLLAYLLTGEMGAEETLASTTQMVDLQTGDWAYDLLHKLELPTDILPRITASAAVRGKVLPGVHESGQGVPVVAVGSHDTASAVAAVPASGKFAYISSGTWSLLGTELETPRPSVAALEAGLTNERAVGGATRLLRNVMGLWIIQECRRTWAAQGKRYDYAQIADMAEKAPPCAALIDPDDEAFLAPGDMPARIAAYCAQTGQRAPEDDAGIARIVFDSLALKYRWAIERLMAISETVFEELYIVGGGSQNPLLNRLTADALNLPVHAGLPEATAVGNLLVQAMAMGEIGSLAQLREASRSSFPLETYLPAPEGTACYAEAYPRFCALLNGGQA